MDDILYAIAKRLWPELETMNDHRRLVGIGDVISFLYLLPLGLAGLVWLLAATDLSLMRREFFNLLILLVLIFVFSRVSYFIIVEIRTDRYGSAEGSLANMALWSGVFLFGASAIWLQVVRLWIDFAAKWRKSISTAARWSLVRNLAGEHINVTFALLIAVWGYRSWGGAIPLDNLSVKNILPALGAIFLHFILMNVIWLGYVLYHAHVQKQLTSSGEARPIWKFFLLSIGLPYLALPFSILAAGLYVQNGLAVYLFLLSGLLLVAFLARQLSQAVESSRQQSRQLEKLEQIGRAIINTPPDESSLTDILQEHLSNMFPSGRLAIWLAPDRLLYDQPEGWPPVTEQAWQWVKQQSQAMAFRAGELLPWGNDTVGQHASVIAPILESESSRVIGGIYLELRALTHAWDRHSLNHLFPAIQSLGALIASALHQSEFYARQLDYQNVTQELRLAGKIQASFLPNQFPSLPGWQLAVTLLPARETSGDFFDVIQLTEGRLGIVIADVTDKGVGAALYMALSRTLIRTYALEYDAEPDVVFFAANGRLLRDARANLFVTAFYGILDPSDGTLTYCNAGHNPPFLLSAKNEGAVEPLSPTGMAMGIEEEATWQQASIQIAPGDVLVFYTDGIPDTQNSQGEFFDEEGLIEVVQARRGRPAHEIQSALLEAVNEFAGEAPQFDDITLMVLLRDV